MWKRITKTKQQLGGPLPEKTKGSRFQLLQKIGTEVQEGPVREPGIGKAMPAIGSSTMQMINSISMLRFVMSWLRTTKV